MKEKLKMNKENACILILVGILCMVVVWPTSKDKSKTEDGNEKFHMEANNEFIDPTESNDSLNGYIENQEMRLRNILRQIDGAGDVQVMIRASASKTYVVEKDKTTSSSIVYETDSEGGTRKSEDRQIGETSLYTKDENGNDIPWIVKEMEPEIEGVLVAAQGADQDQVTSEITQAIQVLFDIPVHKIKVVKLKVQ